MRTLLILLSSLMFFGCSHKEATLPHHAIEFVEAGKDVTWVGGYVLHITKRDGNSIQGIRLLTKAPDGIVTTITANSGTISEGPALDSVKIVLYDAKSQSAKMQASYPKFDIDLFGPSTIGK